MAGRISRRTFLRAGAAGSVAAALGASDFGRLAAVWADDGKGPGHGRHHDSVDIVERSILSLQRDLNRRHMSATELLQAYLDRIDDLDRNGPKVNSMIELNPDAMAIAAQLDRERKRRGPRSLLHGIPIVVKDNIASADAMQTTAGSLSLVGAKVAADATLLANLRAAGAVLLGKTNLSEWANFRSFKSNSGWSGRGGLTTNPYVVTFNACGSSSGSGSAASASFAAAAVGTETDGSVTCPSSICGIVGLKPTHGLIAGDGIVPIAHSQDTAGPMGRTVADVAVMLAAMTGQRTDRFVRRLNARSLRGARVGVARQWFGDVASDPNAAATAPIWEEALATLRDAGATVIDPVVIEQAAQYGDTEFTVLLYEFKHDLNEYLASLVSSPVRSLADVIDFNIAHADQELQFFDQSIMDAAQAKGDLTEPEYLDALQNDITKSRFGLDKAFTDNDLDVIVYPTTGPAWKTELGSGDTIDTIGFTSAPAVSGYPHVTVPAGFVGPLPVGFSFVGRPNTDGRLLSLAFAYEHASNKRERPHFLASLDATSTPWDG